MSVNRLSGPIPKTLRDTNSSVSVDHGNLFGCPLLSDDDDVLSTKSPTQSPSGGGGDGDSDDTTSTGEVSCGSENLDFSVYTWIAAFITAVVTFILCLSLCSSRIKIIAKLVHDWMEASYHHLPLSPKGTSDQLFDSLIHTLKTVKVLDAVSSMSAVLLLTFIFVVMMAYIGLKLDRAHSNSVYQVQYLYTVTAAFFTGIGPAVLLWIFVLVSGSLVVVLCAHHISGSSRVVRVNERASRIDNEDSGVSVYHGYLNIDTLKAIALQLTVVILIVAVALAINYGFVMIIYYGESSYLTEIQIAFTIIKSIFNSFIVPLSSKLIRKESRCVYSMTMKIVVTIAAPAIAILMTSPLCLYYSLNPKYISDSYNSVESGYFVNFSYNSTKLIIRTNFILENVYASMIFEPPWNYSYQCSSSFLVSYLSNFIYLYTITGIVMPFTYIIMTVYSSRSGPRVERFLKYVLGEESSFSSIFTVTGKDEETSSTSSEVEMEVMSSPVHVNDDANNKSCSNDTRASTSYSNKKYDIEVTDLVPSLCVDITVLLTFGLASPLLAIPISFSIIINTLLLRLALGRYIMIVSSDIGQAACYMKLESAFQDAWKGLSGITIITIIATIIIIIVIIIINNHTNNFYNSDSWRIMSIFIGLFWSLFMFDIIGDSNHIGGVIGAVMMIITCPLIFISLQRGLVHISTSISNNDNKDYKVNNFVEKVSQSIHDSIWGFILSKLMLKSVISTNDNNNCNDGDSNISWTMTETISPMGMNPLHIKN